LAALIGVKRLRATHIEHSAVLLMSYVVAGATERCPENIAWNQLWHVCQPRRQCALMFYSRKVRGDERLNEFNSASSTLGDVHGLA
jgi:hypothetical protein